MCKCTPEIRTPFCGRDGCLPPANREPTETLFAQSVLAEFDRREQAERLDAWERGLTQYAHRSDSTGYVGRMGLEVLTELRQTREQAEALAGACKALDELDWCIGYELLTHQHEQLDKARELARVALRAYREATQ